MNPGERPWYKKKRYLVPAGLVGLVIFTSAASGPAALTQQQANNLPGPAVSPAQQVVTNASAQSAPTQLSNDNYYTNVSGQTVHSPTYTSDGSAPAGASAQCRDGTYSFSQHRSGTCSHHGGVARWL